MYKPVQLRPLLLVANNATSVHWKLNSVHIAMHTGHPGEERGQRAGAGDKVCNPWAIVLGESVRGMATYPVKIRNNKCQNGVWRGASG